MTDALFDALAERIVARIWDEDFEDPKIRGTICAWAQAYDELGPFEAELRAGFVDAVRRALAAEFPGPVPGSGPVDGVAVYLEPMTPALHTLAGGPTEWGPKPRAYEDSFRTALGHYLNALEAFGDPVRAGRDFERIKLAIATGIGFGRLCGRVEGAQFMEHGFETAAAKEADR